MMSQSDVLKFSANVRSQSPYVSMLAGRCHSTIKSVGILASCSVCSADPLQSQDDFWWEQLRRAVLKLLLLHGRH